MKPKLCFVLFVFASNLSGQTAPPAQPLVSVDRSSSSISGNTISQDELLIPPKAIKELQRSQRDYSSGNVQASARHLENALKLYPNYLQARNNLGAQYIELHEYERAISELQKATQMNPNIVQPFNNLGVAFFLLRRYPEAETAARRALSLDPQNSTSRYVLGCTLATENHDTPEAIEMLRATRGKFPEAGLVLAKILLRHGAVDDAKRELQDYLAVPGIENRELVERWLAQLKGPAEAEKSQSHSEGP